MSKRISEVPGKHTLQKPYFIPKKQPPYNHMRTDYSASKYTVKRKVNREMDINQKIKSARKIWLSTHKNADGDGLGSEMAFFHALKSMAKEVFVVHNDTSPERYSFLIENTPIHSANENLDLHESDLAIIFDTHDANLCAPFFDLLQKKKVTFLFIDHHVPIRQKIENVIDLIDENACCTGEIVFELIQKLQIKLTPKIATSLYASLLFDTQNFKFIRNSAKPYDMASTLLKHGADHLLIQKNIFDNWSINKMNFLSLLIRNVDYRENHKIALIRIGRQQLVDFDLDSDDVSDFVDLFMSIQSLEVAIVIREEKTNDFKLSFRSRTHEVLSWAQNFNGGGHLYSSGAWVTDTEENIFGKLDALIKNRNLKKLSS